MNTNQYIPGVCNIGKAEINRRRKAFIFSLILLSVFTYLSCSIKSQIYFAASIIIVFYASVLFFQLRQKFCILYGFLNVFNFDGLDAQKHKVEEIDANKKDRQQVIRILAFSILSSIAYSLVLYGIRKFIF